MTFKVAISAFTTTVSIPASAPAAAAYRARILNQDGTPVAELTGGDPAFTFTGVNTGNYVAEMARLDVAGGVIGTAVTYAFTVLEAAPAPVTDPAPAPDVAVTVPSTLSVTVTPE